MTTFGTYVAVRPTPSTHQYLQEWAEYNDVKLDDDLHVTILYSRKVLPVPPARPLLGHYSAQPLTMGPLGSADLVLKLHAPLMYVRHSKLIELGHTHDFPTYNPHITLMTKGEIPEKLTPFTRQLSFHDEYVEPLIDE